PQLQPHTSTLFPYTTLFRSIESRVPFLDHRLIEFVHSLKDEDLLFLGQTKYILRASLEAFLPKSIAERTDKQTFSGGEMTAFLRSEEHTSELQSRSDLVCRL